MTDMPLAVRPEERCMDDLATIEAKDFVPARDFELSKQFYQDLGFVMAWSDANLAYFHMAMPRSCFRTSTRRYTPIIS